MHYHLNNCFADNKGSKIVHLIVPIVHFKPIKDLASLHYQLKRIKKYYEIIFNFPHCDIIFSRCFCQDAKYFNSNGNAIKGYDPVAYFLQNKAIEGSDSYSYSWNGSEWKFASKANLDSFKLAPEKYAPQYGGYCAYGCSENHLAPTDPNAFTIVGNKLYLNYSLKAREIWLKDTTGK